MKTERRFRRDRGRGPELVPSGPEAAVASRPPLRRIAVGAGVVLLAAAFLAACKSRPPDLTVLTASSEQITYEVPIESPLLTSTRAPTQAEVVAAARQHCAQYKKKAVFVRVIQRATNLQNITYDCVAP